MKNQIIFIGNYSSGKSSLINFLFDAKIRITKLDDTNQKLIEEVPKKIYGKTILDVAGLNVGKRNIEQIKDEIKYSHMVFIVCKYDSYKSRDTEEYIQKCKEYRQGIAKKNIYIVITHADIIYEKESELFRTIENYFKQEEGFYFVDAVSKNPNWGFDLKKKIELELYSEWII